MWGTQSLEIDPHKCGQLIEDNEQRKYNGGKIVFSKNGAGTTGHPHAQRKK